MLETLIHVVIGMYIAWAWAKPELWAKLDAPVLKLVSWAWNLVWGLVGKVWNMVKGTVK